MWFMYWSWDTNMLIHIQIKSSLQLKIVHIHYNEIRILLCYINCNLKKSIRSGVSWWIESWYVYWTECEKWSNLIDVIDHNSSKL